MLVKDVISGCNTGQIDGLTNQLLDRLLLKGYLVKIDHPLIICQGRQNNPYLQPEAYKSLVATVESANREIYLNSVLRSIMQQYMLWKQKRFGICGITAAAPPGKSNHQSGLAIDVQNYLAWRSPLQKKGWEWLGSWDRWHFDYRGGGVRLGKIQIQEWQQLYNEHNPDTKLKVDGIWGAKTAASVANSPIAGFNLLPTYKQGDINYEIGQMQFLLRRTLNLDSDRLPADCLFGSKTVRAITLFQQLFGLKMTGEADPQTIATLLEVNGKESLTN